MRSTIAPSASESLFANTRLLVSKIAARYRTLHPVGYGFLVGNIYLKPAQMMNNHRAGDMGKLTITANEKKMNVSVALGKARVQV
jgi:hypothetical protein